MLEILHRVIVEVNGAPDLQSALDVIVQRVKQAMSVDAASVYLANVEGREYVLMATEGYYPDAIGKVRLPFFDGLVGMVGEREEPVNVEDGPAHPRYRFATETGEENYRGFLGVPIIQHRKVLGVLVVRHSQQRKFADNEVTFLVTLAAQLAGAISHAQASGGITQLLKEVAGGTFALNGRPGAPGVAIGKALVVYPPADLSAIPDRKADDPKLEEARLRAAAKQVQEDLRWYKEQMRPVLPEEELALFDALAMMLDGDTLIESAVEGVHAGNWAEGALRETIEQHVKVFENMEDPYLRERAGDIRDLGVRVLTRLQAETPKKLVITEPMILVGANISVGQMAEVPAKYFAGVVSARGSGSSHVAILARALGIPAVMGVNDLPVGRLEGQEVVVDGYSGQVYVRPSSILRAEFKRLAQEEAELAGVLRAQADAPSETKDGVYVPLYVNTGLASDITPSRQSRADGVGLYRTEIPFMASDGFPGEDEQTEIYRQVLEAFAPRPVTLRTLDVGGDKPLPYFPINEDNPFLGWRGIRLTLDHPEIFLTQLRAMLRASAGLENLHVLFPMVSAIHEVDEAKDLLKRAARELLEEGETVRMPPVGVMIEVPSAAYQIDVLSKRVDFFSVGTNDLTQYLLAVDRNNNQVAELYDSLHPAVLAVLRMVVDAVHRNGKTVSICGEMAGDPAGVIPLLGLGVDSLSLSATNLLRSKWVIRNFSITQARDLLETALLLEDAKAVRAHFNLALEEAGLGGLVRAGK